MFGSGLERSALKCSEALQQSDDSDRSKPADPDRTAATLPDPLYIYSFKTSILI